MSSQPQFMRHHEDTSETIWDGGGREVHAWTTRPIWPHGNMNLRRSICCVILLCLWGLSSPVVLAQNPTITEAQREFFEKKIRPVLAEKCYDCHNSSNKKKGGLALDWSQPLRQGGKTLFPGPAGPSLIPLQTEARGA